MNFLAHIYLSGNDKELQIGNFIADGIRGKDYLKFPEQVSKGIVLHRAIDTFTDNHEIFRHTKRIFQPKYGLYSGIIVDLVYDHFLAKNWHEYHSEDLYTYTQNFYSLLQANLDILPDKTLHLLPYMKQQNWLYSYRTLQGIGQIMAQMDRRTGFKSQMTDALKDLTSNYHEIQHDFTVFFVELIKYTQIKLFEINQR